MSDDDLLERVRKLEGDLLAIQESLGHTIKGAMLTNLLLEATLAKLGWSAVWGKDGKMQIYGKNSGLEGLTLP